MKTKTVKTRNLVAKHARKSNRAMVHENKKRKARNETWDGFKKGSLWDLI